MKFAMTRDTARQIRNWGISALVASPLLLVHCVTPRNCPYGHHEMRAFSFHINQGSQTVTQQRSVYSGGQYVGSATETSQVSTISAGSGPPNGQRRVWVCDEKTGTHPCHGDYDCTGGEFCAKENSSYSSYDSGSGLCEPEQFRGHTGKTCWSDDGCASDEFCEKVEPYPKGRCSKRQ